MHKLLCRRVLGCFFVDLCVFFVVSKVGFLRECGTSPGNACWIFSRQFPFRFSGFMFSWINYENFVAEKSDYGRILLKNPVLAGLSKC